MISPATRACRVRSITGCTATHSTLVDDVGRIAGEVAGVKEVVNRMAIAHGPRPLG